jgi:hypothetical protein
MLTGSALAGVEVKCPGVDVSGGRVRHATPARRAVPGAGIDDPSEAGRLFPLNTTQDAPHPRGCGFNYTRGRWVASDLRLGSRSARDGLPGSARLVAAMESAINGG